MSYLVPGSCGAGLLRNLRKRGRGKSQESGAFLLGYCREGKARIVEFVLYDDLDPNCLKSGIVRFNGRYFGDLWAICKSRGVSVVADIHVHPGEAAQSESDRAHPMISRAGHLTLILPRFASRPIRRASIGIYRYEGAKQWVTISPPHGRTFFPYRPIGVTVWIPFILRTVCID